MHSILEKINFFIFRFYEIFIKFIYRHIEIFDFDNIYICYSILCIFFFVIITKFFISFPKYNDFETTENCIKNKKTNSIKSKISNFWTLIKFCVKYFHK